MTMATTTRWTEMCLDRKRRCLDPTTPMPRPEAMSPMSWDDATQALPGMADLEGPQGASMSQDSVC